MVVISTIHHEIKVHMYPLCHKQTPNPAILMCLFDCCVGRSLIKHIAYISAAMKSWFIKILKCMLCFDSVAKGQSAITWHDDEGRWTGLVAKFQQVRLWEVHGGLKCLFDQFQPLYWFGKSGCRAKWEWVSPPTLSVRVPISKALNHESPSDGAQAASSKSLWR